MPACYDGSADIRYPVVYLLHGAGTDATQWLDVGATTTSDELTQRHQIGASILVMPDRVDMSVADAAADLVQRIIPWADTTFRTLADRSHRVIGGISRGGEEALLAAVEHPELFAAVAAHSATLPVSAANLAGRLQPFAGQIWLDVGDGDGLAPEVTALGNALSLRGIAHQLKVSPGRHDRPYWRAHMPEYIDFDAARWRKP